MKKIPLLGSKVVRKSDDRVGVVMTIHETTLPADPWSPYGPGRWVAVMFDPPDSYGCTTDMMISELRRAR